MEPAGSPFQLVSHRQRAQEQPQASVLTRLAASRIRNPGPRPLWDLHSDRRRTVENPAGGPNVRKNERLRSENRTLFSIQNDKRRNPKADACTCTFTSWIVSSA